MTELWEEFFRVAKAARDAPLSDQKVQLLDSLRIPEYKHPTLAIADEEWLEPSWQNHCRIVDVQSVPSRAHLHTNEGLAVFLHAVAHIEYVAIDLALDAIFRFRGLPLDFYEDFLLIARDEWRHFGWLSQLLQRLGFDYGTWPVHNGLHDAARNTSSSLVERMAVVPRYLEANGLDANPVMRGRLSRSGYHPLHTEVLQVLEQIEKEEIGHVTAGDRWFRYACQQHGISTDIYPDLVRTAIPGTSFGRKSVNLAARLSAGFTRAELESLYPGNF